MAYIGYFPVSNGFRAVRFRQKTITKKTETASGRVIRATNAVTKWTGTLTFPPIPYEEFMAVQAFVARCQGPLNEFDLVIPEVSTHASHSGQITSVRVDASAGATSVEVVSDNTNKTILHAGDVIRFPNHTKVYMVTEDATTDGAGETTVYFTPGLVTAVDSNSAGEPIVINNVPFRMILTNDIQEYGYRNDGFIEFEIDVEEVI